MIFLTLAELASLTGYKRRSCIIRWLQANGFAFRVAADGYPRVLQEHVREMLGGPPSLRKTVPNLSALRNSRG